MTDPLVTVPNLDATPWIATILGACRSLGATITETRGESCYISRGAYGTPSCRRWFDHERKVWRKEGPESDVTVYRAEWPLEPIPGYGLWSMRTTGPSMYQIARVCGVKLPESRMVAMDAPPAGSGVKAVLIYARAATLQENGTGGRGVVLAQGRRPSAVAEEDERGVPYLATNATGELEIG